MNHAQKSVARQLGERKIPKAGAEQNGNSGRDNRHRDVDQKDKGRKAREQPGNYQRAAGNFRPAHERPDDIGRRNADLREAARAEIAG